MAFRISQQSRCPAWWSDVCECGAPCGAVPCAVSPVRAAPPCGVYCALFSRDHVFVLPCASRPPSDSDGLVLFSPLPEPESVPPSVAPAPQPRVLGSIVSVEFLSPAHLFFVGSEACLADTRGPIPKLHEINFSIERSKKNRYFLQVQGFVWIHLISRIIEGQSYHDSELK